MASNSLFEANSFIQYPIPYLVSHAYHHVYLVSYFHNTLTNLAWGLFLGEHASIHPSIFDRISPACCDSSPDSGQDWRAEELDYGIEVVHCLVDRVCSCSSSAGYHKFPFLDRLVCSSLSQVVINLRRGRKGQSDGLSA